MRMGSAAGYLMSTPASGSSFLEITSLTPVTIRLTNGSLANDLLTPAGPEPTSSESEPKPSVENHNPKDSKKEVFCGIPVGDTLSHPRHRPTACVRSQGPKTA